VLGRRYGKSSVIFADLDCLVEHSSPHAHMRAVELERTPARIGGQSVIGGVGIALQHNQDVEMIFDCVEATMIGAVRKFDRGTKASREKSVAGEIHPEHTRLRWLVGAYPTLAPSRVDLEGQRGADQRQLDMLAAINTPDLQ